MSQLDLARLQFAMTSIYHFLFVPVTIGLAFLVAILQTVVAPHRATRTPAADPVLRHAAGDQRRGRRGHRAGAGVPVRHELVGVLAVRRRRVRRAAGDGGAGRVLPRVDVPRAVGVRLERAAPAGPPATIWLVAVGGALSAAFIMAANSWMQHPVGYKINADTGRPQLNDIWAVFTNPVFIWGYVHVLLASLVTGARRDARRLGLAPAARRSSPRCSRRSARLSLVVLVPAIAARAGRSAASSASSRRSTSR